MFSVLEEVGIIAKRFASSVDVVRADPAHQNSFDQENTAEQISMMAPSSIPGQCMIPLQNETSL